MASSGTGRECHRSVTKAIGRLPAAGATRRLGGFSVPAPARATEANGLAAQAAVDATASEN